MRLKILITGAQGQLGQALLAQPSEFDVVGLGRTELDITQPHQIVRALFQHKPHLIINCAAFTNVNQAELEPELATEINARGVENLVRSCQQKNIKLVHISTDYVFSGNQSRPYVETDAPAPLNHYGRTKLAGEQAALMLGKRALVVRTSWLYGPQGKNFYTSMQARLESGLPLALVTDHLGTPTLASDCAQVIWQLAKALWLGQVSGIRHVAGSQVQSWYQLGCQLWPEAQVEPINHAQLAARMPIYGQVSRPANSALASLYSPPI